MNGIITERVFQALLDLKSELGTDTTGFFPISYKAVSEKAGVSINYATQAIMELNNCGDIYLSVLSAKNKTCKILRWSACNRAISWQKTSTKAVTRSSSGSTFALPDERYRNYGSVKDCAECARMDREYHTTAEWKKIMEEQGAHVLMN